LLPVCLQSGQRETCLHLCLPCQGLPLRYRGAGNQHPCAAPGHHRAQPGWDPRTEGSGGETVPSLTQRCWALQHIVGLQESLGAVICSPARARGELPPASPAPDTVAANQTAHGCSLAVTPRRGWMEARDGWLRALSDCFPNGFANTSDPA